MHNNALAHSIERNVYVRGAAFLHVSTLINIYAFSCTDNSVRNPCQHVYRCIRRGVHKFHVACNGLGLLKFCDVLVNGWYTGFAAPAKRNKTWNSHRVQARQLYTTE